MEEVSGEVNGVETLVGDLSESSPEFDDDLEETEALLAVG
jgi:hypothetical protein